MNQWVARLKRGGWYFGREEFREELLAQAREVAGPEYGGPEVGESAAAHAEGILREELERLGWRGRAEEPAARRKGGSQKLRIAQRRRRSQGSLTRKNCRVALVMGVAKRITEPLPMKLVKRIQLGLVRLAADCTV